MPEKFGVTRKGETGVIKHFLGDRTCDQCGAAAVNDILHPAPDRFVHACGIRLRRSAGGINKPVFKRHHGQRRIKSCCCFGGCTLHYGNIESKPSCPGSKQRRVSKHVESRERGRFPHTPGRDDDFRPDTRRLTDGHRQSWHTSEPRSSAGEYGLSGAAPPCIPPTGSDTTSLPIPGSGRPAWPRDRRTPRARCTRRWIRRRDPSPAPG